MTGAERAAARLIRCLDWLEKPRFSVLHLVGIALGLVLLAVLR